MIKRVGLAILSGLAGIPIYILYLNQHGIYYLRILVVPVLIFFADIMLVNAKQYDKLAKVYATINTLFQWLFVRILVGIVGNVTSLICYIVFVVIQVCALSGKYTLVDYDIEVYNVIEVYESTMYDLHILLSNAEIKRFNLLMDSVDETKMVKFIVGYKAEDIKKSLSLDTWRLALLIEKENYSEIFSLVND